MTSAALSLRSLVAQDPSNSRFRYMLAMELINHEDRDGAVQAFREQVSGVLDRYQRPMSRLTAQVGAAPASLRARPP